MRATIFFISLAFLVLTSCSGIEESQKIQRKEMNERKDLIHRRSNEVRYPKFKLVTQVRDPYPWEVGYTGAHPRITKDAFRCKGDVRNLPKPKEGNKGFVYHDCGGLRKHSLPVRGGKEFVYPILLDLLNYIQVKTGCPVVITCGHRCPAHHSYADPSVYNISSKHMIGAEVDFYVAGLENKQEEVVDLIMRYYKETECYNKNKEYETFLKLDQVKVDVSTVPLYNKEILIKLYQKNEGRDFDNQHSHPYISLQVRFDREKNERVLYSSEKAFNGYMRY